MKNLTKTQTKTAKLLELAGYNIKRTNSTFALWEGEKRLFGYSSYDFLCLDFMMKEIKKIEYRKGYERGEKSVKQKLHNLLLID